MGFWVRSGIKAIFLINRFWPLLVSQKARWLLRPIALKRQNIRIYFILDWKGKVGGLWRPKETLEYQLQYAHFGQNQDSRTIKKLIKRYIFSATPYNNTILWKEKEMNFVHLIIYCSIIFLSATISLRTIT